jgi:hypothetical protein
MPDLAPWFDCDKVKAKWEARDARSVGQHPAFEQPECRRANADSFPVIDGLFGEAEVAGRSPANLDDDERGGWAWVDRDKVDLVAADMDVPGEDGPAGFGQSVRHQRFGGVA